jgi:hypothetical protein
VGPPTKLGEWRALDRAGRLQWLDGAHRRFFANAPPPRVGRPTAHVIDGEDFDDLPGFLCAMGEAVNGPGGYFGRALRSGDATLLDHIVGYIDSARKRGHWMPAPGIVVVLE